tara:strand:- start:496 stop:741 length:246 start_codon:yes stop_codon:yes gene_type:complete
MSNNQDKLTKSQRKLIEEFQKEFVVSNKYEYSFGKDVCGKSIDIMLPKHHAARVRKKLPRRWKGYRILIMFRDVDKKEEEE